MRNRNSSRWDVKKTTDGLATYELPFKYKEQGKVKMCLVKVKLCLGCSVLLVCAKEMTNESGYRKRKKEEVATLSLFDLAIGNIVEKRKSWNLENVEKEKDRVEKEKAEMKGLAGDDSRNAKKSRWRGSIPVYNAGKNQEEEEETSVGFFMDRTGNFASQSPSLISSRPRISSDDQSRLIESLSPPKSP